MALSWIYSQVARVRNFGFEAGLIKSYRAPVPVISVGNLSVGGTGKTPFTFWLCRELLAKSQRVAIVSRGYGRNTRGSLRVEADHPDGARTFGDEPFMLKTQLPEVEVWVSEKREQGIRDMLEVFSPSVIVLDDGFQHRFVERDLNLCLLDLSRPLKEYQVLPAGRLREPLSSLERADVAVFTKKDFATNADAVQSLCRSYLRPKVLQLVTDSHMTAEGVDSVDVYLLSALGNPAAFQAGVENQLGKKVIQHFKFPDHHRFGQQDLDQIKSELSKSVPVLCTAKDLVKLSGLEIPFELHSVDLEMKPSDNHAAFWSLVSKKTGLSL